MLLGILALLTSFSISTIAIYFSVTGWMALFAAQAFGVMLMFGSLEIGKLVAAGFIHWYWREMPKIHKMLLVLMVIIMMILTSVGIFGFLSKGHLDQEVPASNAGLQIERVEQQIKMHERRVDDASTQLEQLDEVINTLIEYDKISGPDGARAVRQRQDETREFLNDQIENSLESIDELQDRKLQYKQEISDVEAKLGPLQYIIDVLKFEDKDIAVQTVILAAIFVFDPFAVALLLAGLWSFKIRFKKKEPIKTEPVRTGKGKTTAVAHKPEVVTNKFNAETKPKKEKIVPNAVYNFKAREEKRNIEESSKKNELQSKKSEETSIEKAEEHVPYYKSKRKR